MILRPHRMPAALFDAFSEGGGGAVGAQYLVNAQRSKNLLLVRALVDLAADNRHPHAAAVREAYAALRHVHHHAPETVLGLLSYPAVSAWSARTVSLLARGDSAAAAPERLASVAAAAAVRERVPLSLDLRRPGSADPLLVLPSLGAVHLPGGEAGRLSVRVRDGDAEVVVAGRRTRIPDGTHPGPAGWTGIPRIVTHCHGLTLDVRLDALSWRDVPETDGQPRLDENPRADVGGWRRDVTGGWEILSHRHRRVAEEVATAIVALAPLHSPAVGMNSGTIRDAFGCIATSRPPDARLGAVTLAHEIQHAKLAALMDLFTLVTPGPEGSYYAPWRDDPRPLVGLLHGVYAHFGVAAFWREQRHHEPGVRHELRAHTEFARWRRAASEVAQLLLTTDRLTPTGHRLVAGLSHVLDQWQQDPVPRAALARAHELADRHRARWRATHGRTA